MHAESININSTLTLHPLRRHAEVIVHPYSHALDQGEYDAPNDRRRRHGPGPGTRREYAARGRARHDRIPRIFLHIFVVGRRGGCGLIGFGGGRRRVT